MDHKSFPQSHSNGHIGSSVLLIRFLGCVLKRLLARRRTPWIQTLTLHRSAILKCCDIRVSVPKRRSARATAHSTALQGNCTYWNCTYLALTDQHCRVKPAEMTFV